LDQKINPDTKEIKLVYGGNEFDADSEKRLFEKADDLGIGDANIILKRGLKINDKTEENQSSSKLVQMTGELNLLKLTLMQKDNIIDSLRSVPAMGESLLKEIKPLYPTINSCIYSSTAQYIDTLDASIPVYMVYLSSKEEFEPEDELKIYNWLKNRLKADTVFLKF
jgi:hypothetical protein